MEVLPHIFRKERRTYRSIACGAEPKEKSKNGYRYIEIIRDGAISTENIQKVALECKYKGVI